MSIAPTPWTVDYSSFDDNHMVIAADGSIVALVKTQEDAEFFAKVPEMEREIAELKNELAHFRKATTELLALKPSCDACPRSFNDPQKEIDRLQSEVTRVALENVELKQQIETLTVQRDSANQSRVYAFNGHDSLEQTIQQLNIELSELRDTYESCNRARQEAERVCAEQKAIITCNESVLSLIDRIEKELAKSEDEEVLYPGRFGTIVWMRDEITKQRDTIAELVAACKNLDYLRRMWNKPDKQLSDVRCSSMLSKMLHRGGRKRCQHGRCGK